MRIQLLTLFCLLSLSLNANQAQLKDGVITSIFQKTSVSSFIEMVKAIKEGKVPSASNPFFTQAQSSNEAKEFWKTFPIEEYEKGLRKQFQDLFNFGKLKNVESFYSNPFPAKILLYLNSRASLINLNEKLRADEGEDIKVTKNKLTLIQSLINLHKINPLIEDQKDKLKKEIARSTKLMEILKYGRQSDAGEKLTENEALLDNYDTLMVRYFAKSLSDIRESEIRELVRVMKSSTIQDAGQLIVSYHYYFLDKEMARKTITDTK